MDAYIQSLTLSVNHEAIHGPWYTGKYANMHIY